VAALNETLIHVSWLAVHLTGHLAELDINPLRVLPAGHAHLACGRHRTGRELWRVVFRRRYFTSRAALQRALDGFMHYYNTERPHQGYRVRGRTPAALVWAWRRPRDLIHSGTAKVSTPFRVSQPSRSLADERPAPVYRARDHYFPRDGYTTMKFG
jgi:hypothetical protein